MDVQPFRGAFAPYISELLTFGSDSAPVTQNVSEESLFLLDPSVAYAPSG